MFQSVKLTALVLTCALLLSFTQILQGQQPITIETQVDFAELFVGEGDGLENHNIGGVDYILDPNAGNSFEIPALNTLNVGPGVTIQMAPDFILEVRGTLQSIGLGAAETEFTRFNQFSAWANIQVIGDGIVDLINCEIHGGGDQNWDDGDVNHDWRGMIVVMHVQNGDSPTLNLQDCELYDSETNGITVTTNVPNTELTMNLINVDMVRANPKIQLSGVKIGDPDEPVPDFETAMLADITVDQNLLLNRSDFQNCGLHGFSYYHFKGDCELLNSDYRNNGAETNIGCGIYFCTTVNYQEGGALLVIDNVKAHNNWWDGIRVYNGAAETYILNSQVYSNSQRGIFYDFQGGIERDMVVVYDNDIYENDWEGIFVQKGHLNPQPGAVHVNWNHFWDNGQDIADSQFPLAPWLSANIRLHGRLSSTNGEIPDFEVNACEILNNRIEGGYCGIVIDPTFGGNDGMPGSVDVRNNLQIGDDAFPTYYGLYMEQFEVEQIDLGDMVVVYNNMFSGNHGTIEIEGAGIYIVRHPRENGAWIYNNFISNCVNGIVNLDPTALEFDYTGFFDIDDDNVIGGIEGENNVNGNPLFVGVDDFHLRWDSELLNGGCDVDLDEWNREWNDSPPDEGGLNPGPGLDGSCNDIGIFGGPNADEFHFLDESFDGMEDYSVIRIDDVLTGVLNRDYYYMLGDCEAEEEETLTIEEGTTVVMFPDAKLNVTDATLVIAGTGDDFDERVLFKAQGELIPNERTQANRHAGILVKNGADHEINYLEIWGSNYTGISIVNGAVVNEFTNVNSHHNEYGILLSSCTVPVEDSDFNWNALNGVSMSNCGVNVEFDRCKSEYNGASGMWIVNGVGDITDMNVEGNGWRGIYLANSGAPDLRETNCINNSPLEGQEWEGEGIYLYDTDAFIGWDGDAVCTIEGNKNAGLYCSIGSAVTVEETEIINNNDVTIGTPCDMAEIRLAVSAQLIMNGDEDDATEISDEDENEHVLIYCGSIPATGQIDGTGFNWIASGCDEWEICYPTDANNSALRLLTAETIDDWVTIIADANANNTAKGLLLRARDLSRSGEYASALRIYDEIVAEYPETSAAQASIGAICKNWVKGGRSLASLNNHLADIEIPEDALNLQDKIFYRIGYNLSLMMDFDGAIDVFRNRMRNARDELDNARANVAIEETNLMKMIERDDRNLNSVNGLSAQFDKVEVAHAAAEELDDMQKGKKSTSSVPTMFELESVYPNPFNSSVAINYSISEATLVSVIIFDMEGREVAKPFTGRQQPGSYKQVWEAGSLPSGLYVCKIIAFGQEKSVKLNLIK